MLIMNITVRPERSNRLKPQIAPKKQKADPPYVAKWNAALQKTE
jgi:hypothetical protein